MKVVERPEGDVFQFSTLFKENREGIGTCG